MVIYISNHYQLIDISYIGQQLFKLVTPYLMFQADRLYLKKQFLQYPVQLREYKLLMQNDWPKESSSLTCINNILETFYLQLQQRDPSGYSPSQLHWFYAVLQMVMSIIQQIKKVRKYLKGLLVKRQIMQILKHSRLVE